MPNKVVSTVQQYHADGYEIVASCTACKVHHKKVDLEKLIQEGKGDKPLKDVRVRHACGKTMVLAVIAPRFNWGRDER